MELCPKRKILFLAIAVCIAFSVVFAGNLAAGEIDHDCIGENCPYCLIIEAGQNFLKTLKTIGFLLFTAFLTLFVHISKRYTELIAFTLSPVILKVRFNS